MHQAAVAREVSSYGGQEQHLDGAVELLVRAVLQQQRRDTQHSEADGRREGLRCWPLQHDIGPRLDVRLQPCIEEIKQFQPVRELTLRGARHPEAEHCLAAMFILCTPCRTPIGSPPAPAPSRRGTWPQAHLQLASRRAAAMTHRQRKGSATPRRAKPTSGNSNAPSQTRPAGASRAWRSAGRLSKKLPDSKRHLCRGGSNAGRFVPQCSRCQI